MPPDKNIDPELSFHLLADNIPNLAWTAKADGWIHWYNQRWYEYTGTTPEQMSGWGWTSVHDPERLPEVVRKWKQAIAAGTGFEMVFPLKRADGVFRQFLTRVSPLRNAAGEIFQWFGTNTDVTDQKATEDALRKSNEDLGKSNKDLEFTIESSELGIWDYNPTTGNFSGNDRLKSWFGIPPGNEVSLTIALTAIVEADRDRVTEAITKAINPVSGGAYDIQYRIEHLESKQVRTVHAKGKAWFDDAGKAYRFHGTLEDITHEAIIGEKLKESVEQYEKLIVSSPSAIGILKGRNFTITTANQAIIDIWGKGWEIIGKDYFDALPELADKGYRDVFEKVYKSGEPFNAVESPVEIIQNGQRLLKYYNFLLFPQKDSHGKIEGIGIIATEVTSQAILNAQIKKSERQFRLLADSLPEHVWTIDKNGNFSYANRAFYQYCGENGSFQKQFDWNAIVHPDDLTISKKKFSESLESGQPYYREQRILKHTGEYRWHITQAQPQTDENENILGWVGTNSDIHDQKTFTAVLEGKVIERTQELADTNIKLARSNKELESFAYISSHDLQEPLRKIQMYAGRIGETGSSILSESVKTDFDRIRAAALRMQTLINDLLSYSKYNSGERVFELTDLADVVDEVKINFFEEIKQKGGRLDVGSLCQVKIIPFQFRQVLQNLISNSLKFAKPEVPLVIHISSHIANGRELKNEHLSEDLKYCHIRIADNGIGFDQEFGNKIFELFQRLHSREKYAGTGIGLAIVKRIVENHGGVIAAQSAADAGATFDIYLPA